ncbi:MAG: DUF3592 domain-containing protein [Zoogloeaceae bacterium]|jgi:hypothetical protein|nr:DUF3592 domain-containing protein [Zoogloeaceae bacterium]
MREIDRVLSSVLMICLGTFCIYLGVTEHPENQAWYSQAVHATGVVVDNEYSHKHDGFTSIVEFTDTSGQIHIIRANYAFRHINDVVNIVYAKDDPSNAKLFTWVERYFDPLLCAVMGFSFIWIGIKAFRDEIQFSDSE